MIYEKFPTNALLLQKLKRLRFDVEPRLGIGLVNHSLMLLARGMVCIRWKIDHTH